MRDAAATGTPGPQGRGARGREHAEPRRSGKRRPAGRAESSVVDAAPDAHDELVVERRVVAHTTRRGIRALLVADEIEALHLNRLRATLGQAPETSSDLLS